MAEKINLKKVSFPPGKQKIFVDKVFLKVSVEKAAKLCHVSERTIRDWRRGKYLMNYGSFKVLCHCGRLSPPKCTRFKNRYWYVEKGASKGGQALIEKYGRVLVDPEYRKKKWYEWWEKEGKYKKGTILNLPKSIRRPNFSKELAEFVGIMLGDGGITKYQVVISLHSEDDKKYSIFVTRLIKKLFKVPVGVYYDKNSFSLDLVVSRKKLVCFCVERLGLKIGNKIKQRMDIPDWIKNNEQYSIACVRGLVDTDGCVFIHRYKVNGKIYVYKKLAFTSYSDPLLCSVFAILKKNGLNPRLAQRRDVRLDSVNDMKKYFKIFSSHNLKILKQYKK